MLLTILSVQTAAAREAAVSIDGARKAGAAVIIGGGVGVLAWEEKPALLLIGFCIHF